MIKIIVLVAMLCLPNAVFAQSFLGVGVGTSSGDRWRGSTLELSVGRSYSSGLVFEAGYRDLGSREGWSDVSVDGFSMEAEYSTTLLAGRGYVNFGGGLFLYRSDYATGDASYDGFDAAPILSLSAGYNFKSSLTARLKYGKYILKDDFGSPNRISVALVFNF